MNEKKATIQMNDQDKKEVENLITKAKLETSETRLKIFFVGAGALLGVFGILIPLLVTINSSNQIDKAIERVDKSIEKMQESFKELAGTQLRKAKLQMFIDNNALENSQVYYVDAKFRIRYFELKNVGDAPAENIRVKLYLGEKNGVATGDGTKSWKKRPDLQSDEGVNVFFS